MGFVLAVTLIRALVCLKISIIDFSTKTIFRGSDSLTVAVIRQGRSKISWTSETEHSIRIIHVEGWKLYNVI